MGIKRKEKNIFYTNNKFPIQKNITEGCYETTDGPNDDTNNTDIGPLKSRYKSRFIPKETTVLKESSGFVLIMTVKIGRDGIQVNTFLNIMFSQS
jgi:hypothetical protein